MRGCEFEPLAVPAATRVETATLKSGWLLFTNRICALFGDGGWSLR